MVVKNDETFKERTQKIFDLIDDMNEYELALVEENISNLDLVLEKRELNN